MTNPDDLAYPSYQEGYAPQRGLTKRELFAAMAMQSLIHAQFKEELRAKHPNMTAELVENAVALAAVYQADELIRVLDSLPKSNQ